MKRRDFLGYGALATIGGALLSPGQIVNGQSFIKPGKGRVKNIIFLVSDGMSHGTLNMADLLLQRKEGRGSRWIQLYREGKGTRAYMDTASADSLVTDSAAGSSAWGGGVRVNNGALNVGPKGEIYKPILQKFKETGKSVGCVTTVPITHATPAGFCVNSKSRSGQSDIALQYLELQFDVMMGGGEEYFTKEKRTDKRDLFQDYITKGFTVARNKKEMNAAQPGKPLMAVFGEDGLPYSVDVNSDSSLQEKIPSLSEMTQKAISLMESNRQGFVLQIEGGKVDWAAHANDASALLYDQIAFDDALAVAIDFAEKNKETLVIFTTDHGNACPGLIKSSNVNNKFDLAQKFKHSNEWILNGIKKTDSAALVIDRIYEALGLKITDKEASTILSHYESLENDGIYNAYKLPYKQLGVILQNYISIGWSGMDHSAEFVELGMFGPHSEALPQFIKNTDLHYFMLQAAGMKG